MKAIGFFYSFFLCQSLLSGNDTWQKIFENEAIPERIVKTDNVDK